MQLSIHPIGLQHAQQGMGIYYVHIIHLCMCTAHGDVSPRRAVASRTYSYTNDAVVMGLFIIYRSCHTLYFIDFDLQQTLESVSHLLYPHIH